MTPKLMEDSLIQPHDEGAQRNELLRLLPLITTARGPNEEALRDAWQTLVGLLHQNSGADQFRMTVADFVAKKFVPEHVTQKGVSGRIHYQAILRHVLTPEEVDAAFAVIPKSPRRLIRPVAGWPYMSQLRLCDVQPAHVQRLTTSALERGYSLQTVRHLRNVVSAIFSHAKRELCYVGDNPASSVRLPQMPRRHAHPLTPSQINEALMAMHYPEREMTICAALTGMTPAEISGLQWRHINLGGDHAFIDGMSVPPRTMVVKHQWCRGVLEAVNAGRIRTLPIPGQLLNLLLKLKARPKFTGPCDFVLVSRKGTPVNYKDIVARRLRPIARRLGLPSLSLQALRRTSKHPELAAWASVA